MEAEQIEVVRKWPEPKSVQDIQVFLGFAHFYRQFIQGFSRIAALFSLILKTTNKPASSRNDGSRSATSKNNDSRPASRKNDGNSEVDGFSGDGMEYAKKSGKSKAQKSAKFRKLSKSGKSKCKKSKKPPKSENSSNFDAKDTQPSFLTPEARSAFNRLWLAFIEAPIIWYFDLECHIQVKIDASGYAIGSVLSQLASGTSPDGVVIKTDLGQWYPVAFFSRKMILAEIWYKTHDDELLAIVEVFKTWRHYLKSCKHKIFVFTDYNNLRQFMDTKNLSSRQVRWAPKLSRYHFQIDCCQGKANVAVDALSRFFQSSQDEEDELQAENGRILYCLQNSLTNANLAGLSLLFLSSFPSHLHQVLICRT